MQTTTVPNFGSIVVGTVYKLPISGYIRTANRFRAENNSVYQAIIAPAEYNTVQEVSDNRITAVGPFTNQNIDNKDVNTGARFYSVTFVTAINTPTPVANASMSFTWTVYNPEDKVDDFAGAGLNTLVNPSTVDDIGIPAFNQAGAGVLIGGFGLTDLNGWDGIYLTLWCDETDQQAYFFLNLEFSADTAFNNTRTLQLRYYAKKLYLQLPKLLRYLRAFVYNGNGSSNNALIYGYGRRTQQDIPLKAISTGLTPYVRSITIPSSTALVFYLPVMAARMRITFYSTSAVRLSMLEAFTSSGLFVEDVVITTAGVNVDYIVDVSAPTELQVTTDSIPGVRVLNVSAVQLDNTQI